MSQSDRIIFKKFLGTRKERPKQSWKPINVNGSTKSATITCPDCGGMATLEDHTIGQNGVVNPSLVCPYDDCQFHDWGILEGWES